MSKIREDCISHASAKQYLFNHNSTDADDRISVSSGNSVLDHEYYMNQPPPIPKHVIFNNCVRIDGSKSIENAVLRIQNETPALKSVSTSGNGKSNDFGEIKEKSKKKVEKQKEGSFNKIEHQSNPFNQIGTINSSQNHFGRNFEPSEVVSKEYVQRKTFNKIEQKERSLNKIEPSESVSKEYVQRRTSNKIEHQSNPFNQTYNINSSENQFGNKFQPPQVVSDANVQRRTSHKIEPKENKIEHQSNPFNQIYAINSSKNSSGSNVQPSKDVSEECVPRRTSHKIEPKENKIEHQRKLINQIYTTNSRENRFERNFEVVSGEYARRGEYNNIGTSSLNKNENQSVNKINNQQRPEAASNQHFQIPQNNTFEENALRSQQRSFRIPRNDDIANTIRSNISTEINYNRLSNNESSHAVYNNDDSNTRCCIIL